MSGCIVFLAAYTAVNNSRNWQDKTRNFLAAYTAVNYVINQGMVPLRFLAAYTAVNISAALRGGIFFS